MPRGFFSESRIKSVKRPLPLLAKCEECKLYRNCTSPKIPVAGKGTVKILIVSDNPEDQSDASGKGFKGPDADVIRSALARSKLTPSDVWYTYATICHTKQKLDREVEFCRPNVIDTIESLKPETIVLLGHSAVKSVIGHSWKEGVKDIERWVGWQIPDQKYNAWVCPTYHPKDLKPGFMEEFFFRKHLDAAFGLTGRPWEDSVPNYLEKVNVAFDDHEAALAVDRISDSPAMAFDYETNMLKPDSEAGFILCCSVSNGKETWAFPWRGEAVKSMKRALRKPCRKIASNMKFEERWTRCKLGVRVNNWDIDTMLASHVLDNRPDINSIKFQSYVRLGQEQYDDHVKPFLQAKEKGGYAENRIKDCDLRDLMLYCGLDSLLEFIVASQQRKEIYVR